MRRDFSSPIWINAGCGEIKFPEPWLNINDTYIPNSVDIVDDIRFLRRFKDGSVDILYVSAVLEHFGLWEKDAILKRWHVLLKPGTGILRLSVPSFDAIVDHYLEHKDLRILHGMILGGQDYSTNFHKMIWNEKTLQEDLLAAGFKVTRLWDWKTTLPHDQIDDFSRSYLPHMDFDNGKLMHVNMEAIA